MHIDYSKSTSQQELFKRRLLVAQLLVLVCFGILVARFVYLQVVRHEAFDRKAESNRTSMVPVTPERGSIFDRYGVPLAKNSIGFSLEISPDDLERVSPKETTDEAIARVIERIRTIINITDADIKKFKKIKEDAASHDSIPIRVKLTEDEVARFSVEQFRFKGVEIKKQSFREYPNGSMGVHVVGYVGRLNKQDKLRLEEEQLSEIYRGTTHIGRTGIEQSYESILHGKTGYQMLEVYAGGHSLRELGSQPPVNGLNVKLTIDAYVQSSAEKAFAGRRGALVAIEPSTGEVLAFVSSPTYDPNLFLDGISMDDWKGLNESKNKPLLNRALRGGYPPGSTYKPFMALAALHSGARDRDLVIQDGGIYNFGGHKYRDSTGGRGHGAVNMFTSIAVSSDVYYYDLAYKMGVDLIHQEMTRFGFGQKTGIDLIGESAGLLPSSEWALKRENREWAPGRTINLGIGQGENTMTILQLATGVATIANGGVRMKPYLLKAKIDPVTGQETEIAPEVALDLKIPAADIDLVRRAMVQVNISGTGRGIFNGLPGQVAGKTGTAQVFTVAQNSTYKQSVRGEFSRDHSLYIAFYPADHPKIAVATIVENAGFGASAAAPLVRDVLKAFNESQAGKRFDTPTIMNPQSVSSQTNDTTKAGKP
ncbi:penicillin-binding protein 2 [Hydromonas duriensis]|uniref:Peptidoglycan D,D-transpeptidase MrdA n=1 Tax=Hydromonas duriensis TaxID=1527608 RepID=A0A4R6YBG7_9BURK|nr:penicillin-binding protein 2 [Hydromonas duriensis]TDR32973.1 penicillin-binding protein 2 [Hydromonas duriensis]